MRAIGPDPTPLRALRTTGHYRHADIDLDAILLNEACSVDHLVAVVAVSRVTFRPIEEPTRTWCNRLAGRITRTDRLLEACAARVRHVQASVTAARTA